MKYLVLIALVCAIAAAEKAVTQDLIDTVNKANANWVAGHNKFSEWELDEVRALIGSDRIVKTGVPKFEVKSVSSVPSSFDARTKWSTCIHPIRDQEKCGSCWAFSAAEVLSDRFCIDGGKNIVLSPQDLVSCDHTNMGCSGGQLPATWEYLKSSGIVLDTCMPYTSGGGVSGTCPTTCTDGSAFTKYKAKSYSHIGGFLPFGRVDKIATEIMNNGPVQAAFEVYQDFMSYKSGVYKHVTGSLLGGHAIKVIGWGQENGSDYWLVANSWNTSWGLDGFFKILKGKDECGIESNVYAGPAAV